MPGLDFHPEYERHLSFEALAHCPRHYRHIRDIAEGKQPPRPAGTSVLIGIGADVILGELWHGIRNGAGWDADRAFYSGWEALNLQEKRNPIFIAHKESLRKELQLLAPQYVKQWADVRTWDVEAVHPYDAEVLPARLLIELPGGGHYLTMPDMECRLDGVLTLIDFKTSRYPYTPHEWAYSVQSLTYCLAAESRAEPLQFLIDYCQRPRGKADSEWVFPVTYPFVFDEHRRKLAHSWLAMLEERKRLYAPRSAGMLSDWDDPFAHEQWPRDPSACRTWYGRCEFESTCFGEDQPYGCSHP